MTAEEYIDAVRQLPCCVSGRKPASAHHVVGASIARMLGSRGRKKHSDWLVIPLHYEFHQGENGLHTIGAETWENRYGMQADFVIETGKKFGLDPFAMADDEARERRMRKKYKPSEKIMPRRFQT